MASENESWGSTRIVGELSKLGHLVSRSTVRRILKESGFGPSPERLGHMPWSKFLKAHWEGIAAADFFTVEVWTSMGLVRYLVFFVIDLSNRRVEIAGIAPVPNGLWMRQVARSLIDDENGFLRGKRFLIHDRDPADRRGSKTRLRTGRSVGTAWRNPQPLLPRSRLIGRLNIGTGRGAIVHFGGIWKRKSERPKAAPLPPLLDPRKEA